MTDPTNGLTFPNLNAAPFGGEDFQTNLIMPEPTIFLSRKLPAISIIRPTETHGAAKAALKHSAEAQPITVGISLKEGKAQVWVKDQGLGLSPEAQQRIWDRFSSLPGFIAYKIRRGGELSLGLYISLALVGEHGGHMGVESKPGEGSTFWFTLPLRK